MKVALFGGAFDPPHLGHQRVGQEMISQKVVDEVWYVPVFEHPWAERLNKWEMEGYQQRQEMVELILFPGAKLAEYKDVSFAYPTLEYFSQKFPAHEFSWVIGSEYLPSFKDWKFADRVLAEFGVYVYPRAGFPLQPLMRGMTALQGFPEMNISSTQFREKYQAGLKAAGQEAGDQAAARLVDKKVLRYIKESKLYMNKEE